MPSWGPGRGWNYYVTPAFSGVLDAKRGEKFIVGSLTHAFLGAQGRAELLCNKCVLKVPHSKGDKIRVGYLTPAVSAAQNRVELRCNPCILGGPQRQARGENQKGLPHPCLLGGPKGGGIAT